MKKLVLFVKFIFTDGSVDGGYVSTISSSDEKCQVKYMDDNEKTYNCKSITSIDLVVRSYPS